jgi:hypothetical protein
MQGGQDAICELVNFCSSMYVHTGVHVHHLSDLSIHGYVVGGTSAHCVVSVVVSLLRHINAAFSTLEDVHTTRKNNVALQARAEQSCTSCCMTVAMTQCNVNDTVQEEGRVLTGCVHDEQLDAVI